MHEPPDPSFYRNVLERLLTGVYLVDLQRRIMFWNDGAEQITGYLRHEVIGHMCRDNLLSHCDEAQRELCHSSCPVSRAAASGNAYSARMYLHHRNGQKLPVLVRAVPIRNPEGSLIAVAESFELQALIPAPPPSQSYSSFLESLTNLPNRSFLITRLEQRMAPLTEEFQGFGLVKVSVKEFGELARRYGATACLAAIRGLATTLRSSVMPSDILGRSGPSELLVIVDSADSKVFQRICERVYGAVSCFSMEWWGDLLTIHTSIDTKLVCVREQAPEVAEWLGLGDNSLRNYRLQLEAEKNSVL